MNNVQKTLSAALVFIFTTTAAVNAQMSPEELLESAFYMEEVEGELQGAIELLERITTEHAQNRPVAARALLHLGLCYEKLGYLKAEAVYQRLIDAFGDQQDIVSEARIRLQRIRYRELAEGIERIGRGPTYRMALDVNVPYMSPLRARQYDFSPNGEQIAYQGMDGLYISDATGTLHRRLITQSKDESAWSAIYKYTGQPRWSPDGRQIAYLAGKTRPPGDDPNDQIVTIFLIDSEGGEPHQLVDHIDLAQDGGFCWTPDGKGLTYMALEGVRTLDLKGNTIGRVGLKRSHYSNRLQMYSPDGRWLTFQINADLDGDDNYDKDIYIVPAEGGDEVKLTYASGFDSDPIWSRDGRSIYFVSARSAEPRNTNIWKIQIDSQTGQPVSDPEQVTFFKDALIMHPQTVGDGSRIAFLLEKTKTSIHVAPYGEPEKYQTVARGTGPALSPDGKTVYYVGQGPDHQGIYAVSAEGGSPKKLTSARPAHWPKEISPDGSTIAYFMDQDNGRGLYILPAAGGEPRLILRDDSEECCKSAHWSPNGEWLAYTSGDGLYLISPTGGEPKKLASLFNWESWTVTWSPNGEYIAALGYQEGEKNNAVYVVPKEGGEARLLSSSADYKEGLSWHPDGQSLTYHLSKVVSQTFRTYLDGRPPELFLDKLDAWDYVGRWSPDGEHYFLDNSREGVWYLDVYDVSTGEFTPFAENAGIPTWSGDRETIAWTTAQEIRQVWLMEDFI